MIRTLQYNSESGCQVHEGILPFEDILRDNDSSFWIDFENPTEEESYILYSDFKFHPLIIEDTLEASNPKLDVFKDYLYMVFHATDYIKQGELASREIDFFLGRNYVVTSHKSCFPTLDRLAEKCRRDDRILSRGADFIFHTLVDTLVDDYNVTLKLVAETIDKFEAEIFSGDPDRELLKNIFELKEDIAELKRKALAQRDIMWRFSRGEYKLTSPESAIYFRDIYDHLSHINDKADHFRDLLKSVMDAYFSVSSDKTNKIMKTLTVFTAILLPLSVIASIYGMNFKGMPEIQWDFGYYFALGLMVVVAGITLVVFKVKGWL
ncbi:MAG: magnesium/cobalt transporter CorA [candidate division Zixibacteria bacterium]|nr:magnesium/cobalt transporter CorA [candidate division Zixibacteria bacterium]